ncbi:MAG: ATP-binding protein [Lachnospiraceae bacterium]|nr:ATP-binding protein [Lachnospiraceae bacterium]
MRQKILKNVTLTVSLAVVLAFILIELVSYRQFYANMQGEVRNEAAYVQIGLNEVGEGFLDQSVADITNSRITLIDADGKVLWDSVEDASEMENHRNRPEVVQAMEHGSGESSRVSATLGESTYYYALRMEDGHILRIANTVSSVFGTMLSGFTMIIIILILVIVLSVFVTHAMTKRLVDPINKLNLEHPEDNEIYEELAPLLRRIEKQNEVISEQVVSLKSAHQEYLAITDNMKDGLIVTNRTSVLSLNKAALKLFRIQLKEVVNKNILTVSRLPELKEAWDQAVAGKPFERNLQMEQRVYQILANPVVFDGEIQGAVMFILDVTQKERADQMRREFSANVSHELKTPLMSISGYAELIQNNMVRKEDIAEFAGRIHSEANRLTTLVQDIIKLSQLDEMPQSTQMEDVDLYTLSQEIVSGLLMAARNKGIKIGLSGESAVVPGVRQVLYEMLYNLCDNAVQYNQEGGSVSIELKQEGQEILWSVTDTGIGIPAEEQERIFERFYRVDKSHSRASGGTGLGLSIVKHGAMLHHVKIDMDSEVGKGTTILLHF